jgi:outer membrane protein TolC
VQRSLTRRADYQSALRTEQATATLLTAARNQVKPQLDLNLEAGYTGLDEGSQFRRFYGALDPWTAPGPNLLATLRMEWPFGNNAAKGLLVQRQASHQQSLTRSQDLVRTITSGIAVALNELERAMDETRRAREAVELYQRAVGNEREKLHLGSSTVLDVINVADRYANSRLRLNAAQARYANALARVRFETGQWVPPGVVTNFSLSLADFVTLP